MSSPEPGRPVSCFMASEVNGGNPAVGGSNDGIVDIEIDDVSAEKKNRDPGRTRDPSYGWGGSPTTIRDEGRRECTFLSGATATARPFLAGHRIVRRR